MPVTTAADLSASYFVLMDPATGKVLNGASALVDYATATQNLYWSISIVDNGNNTGVAKFKNKETGEFLADASGVHTTVEVEKVSGKWQLKSAVYANVAFNNAPAV